MARFSIIVSLIIALLLIGIGSVMFVNPQIIFIVFQVSGAIICLLGLIILLIILVVFIKAKRCGMNIKKGVNEN